MIFVKQLAFSSLSIALMFLIGFFLLYLSLKAKSRVRSFVLRNWGIGFLLIPWVRIPTVLGSLNVTLFVDKLEVFYAVLSIPYIIGFIFLFRGSMALLSKRRLWLTFFPIFIFAAFIATAITSFILDVPMFYRMIMSSFYTTSIIFFVIFSSIYSFSRGNPKVLPLNKSGLVLFSIGMLILASNIFHLLIITKLGSFDLWFIYIGEPSLHLIVSIAHFLIFSAFLLGSAKEKR